VTGRSHSQHSRISSSELRFIEVQIKFRIINKIQNGGLHEVVRVGSRLKGAGDLLDVFNGRGSQLAISPRLY